MPHPLICDMGQDPSRPQPLLVPHEVGGLGLSLYISHPHGGLHHHAALSPAKGPPADRSARDTADGQ